MPRLPLVTIRPARPSDLPVIGRLGAALAHAHHEWDPERFFVVDDMAAGYAWWLGRELGNRAAVVLVAACGRRIVGYTYGRIEARDWNLLRDRCGVGIDLIVVPEARGAGTGLRLGEALLEALRAKGAPRVVLQAAAKNGTARRFFRALGFRPTLIEMTRELDRPSASRPRRPTRK